MGSTDIKESNNLGTAPNLVIQGEEKTCLHGF